MRRKFGADGNAFATVSLTLPKAVLSALDQQARVK
jgi:hypothetical protein